MRHLDLFSGIGGFALAARWAGIETVHFVEIDSFCQKVLAKNFPTVPIVPDINHFGNFGKVDLITVGLPCQPFSQAGKKKGKEDKRYLWKETLRVIKESNPYWIIIENVCGIVSLALDDILTDLEDQNYTAETFVLPACAANAPHRRDRIWVIAHLNGIGSNRGVNYLAERPIQENIPWDMEKIQQEWSQFIPDSWETLTARDWFQYNRKLCGRDNGLSRRMDRIKALGNAIVPQVVYPLLKFITTTGSSEFEPDKSKI